MTQMRAYISASGEPKSYVLTHDVKKCLATSQAASGWIHVLSTGGTTAVTLMENDSKIITPLMARTAEQFSADLKLGKARDARRSGLSEAPFHCMAARFGLTLTIPFENGKLLSSVHQDILALDFEPKAGRREFVLSVLPKGAEGK